MATVNYTISSVLQGFTWVGSFVVDSTSSLFSEVNSIEEINVGTLGFSFVPTQFESYGGSDAYVTWRSISFPGEQFPGNGYSFDIWANDLYNLTVSGATWQDIINTGTFSLNTGKNTLVYNYDAPGLVQEPTKLFYGRGGNIRFYL
jgi:hypothetical protein